MSIEFIGTIAAAVVILAITAGVTARKGRIRPLLIGLGLALIPVGLYLTGVLRLMINGVTSIVDWFQRTMFTDGIAWGLGLLVGGVLLSIVGVALPKKPARERAAKEQPAPRQVPKQSAQPLLATKPAAQPGKPAPKAKPKDAPGEFDEIEELLRKRGIM